MTALQMVSGLFNSPFVHPVFTMRMPTKTLPEKCNKKILTFLSESNAKTISGFRPHINDTQVKGGRRLILRYGVNKQNNFAGSMTRRRSVSPKPFSLLQMPPSKEREFPPFFQTHVIPWRLYLTDHCICGLGCLFDCLDTFLS